ncbi:recombinase zinc beta ribbon domain-containing protein, partial [Methylobacterium sp.]|uniref:recombinase zinc beta ribbon domain-containing protein n=1 Tax=Methylobacterium sp. TaxID=409 RepID=UPI0025E6320C
GRLRHPPRYAAFNSPSSPNLPHSSVFNRRDSKTLIEKPKGEHIMIDVPAIIDRSEFEAVAATLKAHNPRTTPARVVTGPILLTGLATCATCQGPMTMRTGTSKSGRVYTYYSCSTQGRQGKTGCKGRSIPMQKLDTLVTDHLVAELLQPERLRATLASLWALRSDRAAEVDDRVTALRAEVTAAQDKLKRLYAMVEEGVTDLDDILRERVADLKLERDRAKAALDRIQVADRPAAAIAPELVERFGALMRENVTTGEIPFRKAWLQAIVDRIEVDDTVIRIMGDKANLAAVMAAGGAGATASVRSSVRKWRTRHDSNV